MLAIGLGSFAFAPPTSLVTPAVSRASMLSAMPADSHARRTAQPRMESLASQMFGTVAEGLKDLQKGLDKTVGTGLTELAKKAGMDVPEASTDDAPAAQSGTRLAEPGPSKLESAVADLDARAQSGDVTFRDFMTMSRSIAGMNDDLSALPPGLSSKQLLELREKVSKHERIVECMLEEELDDPELLMEDLKNGGSTPGPRMQRLAQASGEPETEVGLFLMQFEAMRESTRRIAAGEDPDEVNESLSAPPGANRQMRRNAKKAKAKKAKNKK